MMQKAVKSTIITAVVAGFLTVGMIFLSVYAVTTRSEQSDQSRVLHELEDVVAKIDGNSDRGTCRSIALGERIGLLSDYVTAPRSEQLAILTKIRELGPLVEILKECSE